MDLEWIKTGIPALFIVVTLGLLLGKIKIGGISLDISGILFVSLIMGHFGFRLTQEFLSFGLVLFVFTVGMQSGPGFFDSFRKNGRKYIFLALIIITITALSSYFVGKIANIDNSLNVGIFAGALTSSPGLAAATDASNSPFVSIAYGISYPIGLVFVILSINILPKLLKIDIKKEETNYLNSLKADYPDIQGKTFKITNPNIDGKLLVDINLREISNCTASRIMHNGAAFTPDNESVLYSGDFVRLVGSEDDLKKAELLFGNPVDKHIPLSKEYDIRWIFATNKEIINKNYRSIDLSRTLHAGIVKIRRSGVEIKPTPATLFKFGDKLLIAGTKDGVKKAAKLIGDNQKKLSKTDVFTIFLGILVGVLVGKIEIPVFGLFNFKLGNTGGALLAGLILSRIHKTGPIIWTMSAASNQLLRNIGLILFLAVIGTNAGEHLLETVRDQGVMLLWLSLLITSIPIFFGIIIGRYFMKLNFLTLLGLITGIMTSTPGLGAIQSKSESNAGTVAYATVYPFALVLVIVFSQILVLL